MTEQKKDDPRAAFAGGVRQLIREHASDDVIDPVYADSIADQIIHDFDIFLKVYDADRAERDKRLADRILKAHAWLEWAQITGGVKDDADKLQRAIAQARGELTSKEEEAPG